MFIQTDRLLCIISVPIFFLLLVASTTNARPTVTSQKIVSATSSRTSDESTIISCTINSSAGYIDGRLAEFKKQFLQPPSNLAALSGTATGFVKPLPAVPAAVLMVLTGFLCVSLVRDRKLWLAVLSGLLCAGQTGVLAVPQLALRLLHKNHTESRTEFTYLHSPEDSYRLRSDLEGTQYIGLLHHLAGIPDSPKSFLPRIVVRDKLQQVGNTQYTIRNTNEAPQFAITQFSSCLYPETNCLASRVEQFICFSPAFIFSRIPRGPPIRTGRATFT